jgi:hypothetical protein
MVDIQNTATTTILSSVKWLGIGAGIIAFITIAIIGSIIFYKRKKWNLRLEIKLARSDGQLILSDKGKGYWDSKNGWIVIKRKGYKAVHSRPIDPKEWLQGRDFATLIQVGPEDFIIARESSYSNVIDSATNQGIALMSVVADVGKRKTWKNYTERMAKKAFTITGWMEEHWRAVELAIIIFVMFLGFAVLWMRLPSICNKIILAVI